VLAALNGVWIFIYDRQKFGFSFFDDQVKSCSVFVTFDTDGEV
jgi:hypothetical protein